MDPSALGLSCNARRRQRSHSRMIVDERNFSFRDCVLTIHGNMRVYRTMQHEKMSLSLVYLAHGVKCSQPLIPLGTERIATRERDSSIRASLSIDTLSKGHSHSSNVYAVVSNFAPFTTELGHVRLFLGL